MVEKIQEIFPTLPEAKGHKLAVGRVASGDQFIAEKAKKEWLADTFSGMCTEMEGAAVAHAAYRNGVPFLIIRAISDKADDSEEMSYVEFVQAAAENCAAITRYMIAH